MKVTKVETFTVVVPLHEGSWHSPEYDPDTYYAGGAAIRQPWPDFPIVIIQLHTDEGLIGLGEVPKGVPAERVMAAAEYFVGRDLWSFNLQELPFSTTWSSDTSVAQGYEIALYDLVGKALGVPVYRLFGGKFRDEVAVSRCSGRMTPADAAKAAKEAVALGYSVLKMKTTADDPLVNRLGAIQDAVGDKLHVVIDPNQRFYQPYRLIQIMDQFEAAGISNVQCIESPYDHSNLDWYVLARQKLRVPIALHLNTLRETRDAIKREACDWLNIGGTMVTTYKQAAMAEAAGIPCWHGSGVGLGISEAAYTHISSACRAVVLTSDICGETLRVDDLIRESLTIANGYVRVPEGPGLGIELDEDALDRYRIA